MLTSEIIKTSIQQGEGSTIEFKTSFGDEAIVALNAFANTKGGIVLIGVNNKGKIVGTQLNRESIAEWINETKSKTEPSIVPDAEEFTIEGKIKIFDNRIEFFNPGRLPDDLTVEQLLSDNYTPQSRNKQVNLMFKEIGLVEKYGSGIRRIINTCKEHGDCTVDFFNEQHGFKVIVTKTDLKTDLKTENIDDIDKFIMKLIAENVRITIPEIARKAMKGVTVIKTRLSKLKRLNLIKRTGSLKGGYWEIINKE